VIQILSLDHVVLRVHDVKRSLEFYCEVLGCRVERQVEQLGLIQLRAGTSLIDLVDLQKPLGQLGGAPPGEGGRNVDHIALRIESFDAEKLRAHLHAHGIEPGQVDQRYGADGVGPSMYIRDPDGNVVELKGPPAEPRPRSPVP
jgi:catechol 2,3-dioxygenase-like lactoylglutathione lyase family enzyme